MLTPMKIAIKAFHCLLVCTFVQCQKENFSDFFGLVRLAKTGSHPILWNRNFLDFNSESYRRVSSSMKHLLNEVCQSLTSNSCNMKALLIVPSGYETLAAFSVSTAVPIAWTTFKESLSTEALAQKIGTVNLSENQLPTKGELLRMIQSNTSWANCQPTDSCGGHYFCIEGQKRCHPLYYGTNCQSPLKVNTLDCPENRASGCFNGGTCFRKKCCCLKPFTGKLCEKKLDEQLVGKSRNNMVDSDLKFDKKAKAVKQEQMGLPVIEEDAASLHLQSDDLPCSSNPCLNNGWCQDLPWNQFRCHCPLFLSGTRCELIVVHPVGVALESFKASLGNQSVMNEGNTTSVMTTTDDSSFLDFFASFNDTNVTNPFFVDKPSENIGFIVSLTALFLLIPLTLFIAYVSLKMVKADVEEKRSSAALSEEQTKSLRTKEMYKKHYFIPRDTDVIPRDTYEEAKTVEDSLSGGRIDMASNVSVRGMLEGEFEDIVRYDDFDWVDTNIDAESSMDTHVHEPRQLEDYVKQFAIGKSYVVDDLSLTSHEEVLEIWSQKSDVVSERNVMSETTLEDVSKEEAIVARRSSSLIITDTIAHKDVNTLLQEPDKYSYPEYNEDNQLEGYNKRMDLVSLTIGTAGSLEVVSRNDSELQFKPNVSDIS